MSPNQIIRIRKALGLTQQQLADRIPANRVTVARWETGVHEPEGAYLKALTLLEAQAKKKKKTSRRADMHID